MKKSICLLFLIVNILFFTVACMASPDSAVPRPNYDENFQSPSNPSGSSQFKPSPYSAFRFEWNEEYNGYFVYENDNNIYTNLVIPEAYYGKPVVGIGKYAFGSYSKLQSIVIPKSVRVIEANAFNYCDYLVQVLFDGESLLREIKENAFFNCKSIISITVPASVEFIGINAFSTCPLLEKIDVHMNNEVYCSVDGSLYSKDLKTLIATPPAIRGTSFEVPYGVEIIEDGAFFNSDNILNITIPKSVNSLGKNVFGKYLKEINYGGTCEEWNLLNGIVSEDNAPSAPGGESTVNPGGSEKPEGSIDYGYVVNCTDGTINTAR